MLENWKLPMDIKGFVDGGLIDLRKAFHTINQQLILGNLHGYGFSKSALVIINIQLLVI